MYLRPERDFVLDHAVGGHSQRSTDKYMYYLGPSHVASVCQNQSSPPLIHDRSRKTRKFTILTCVLTSLYFVYSLRDICNAWQWLWLVRLAISREQNTL